MSLPLTVIGGFLGAGKTSLVNHLLATATRRYGVLVNDFGAVNVDAALIAAQDGATLALTNGCVPAARSARTSATAWPALPPTAPRRSTSSSRPAAFPDPWRIARLPIEPGFTLGPLIVLADAAAILDQLSDSLARRHRPAPARLRRADRAQQDRPRHRPSPPLRPACVPSPRGAPRHTTWPSGRSAAALRATPRARASRFSADAPAHAFPTPVLAPARPRPPPACAPRWRACPAPSCASRASSSSPRRRLVPAAIRRRALERFTRRDRLRNPGLVFTPDLPDSVVTLLAPFAAAVA